MWHIRSMNTLLKLEEIALFALFSFFFFLLSIDWWWYPILILSPDIGMLGYLINPRVGAATYNALHFRGTGVALFAISAPSMITGVPLEPWQEWLLAASFIILAHASLDRALGYGLKRNDSFQNTHLGWIGKKEPTS